MGGWFGFRRFLSTRFIINKHEFIIRHRPTPIESDQKLQKEIKESTNHNVTHLFHKNRDK